MTEQAPEQYPKSSNDLEQPSVLLGSDQERVLSHVEALEAQGYSHEEAVEKADSVLQD